MPTGMTINPSLSLEWSLCEYHFNIQVVDIKSAPIDRYRIKFLQIVGEDFGSGNPDARVEPFHDAPPADQSQHCSKSSLSQWPYPALLTVGYDAQQHPTATPPPASPAVLLPATPRRPPRLMSRRASPAATAGLPLERRSRRTPLAVCGFKRRRLDSIRR